MLKQVFMVLALGSILGCFTNQTAWAQFRGFGGSRGGSDDRDREEMRRRFEEMRSRGGFGGFGSSRGGSDDRDREEMRRRFEEMRSRGFGGFGSSRGRDDDNDGGRSNYGSFGGYGSSRDRGDDRSSSDRSRFGDSRSRGGQDTGKPAPYQPAPQAPVTVDLPGNYAEGDSDGDGQITLLEWRQWKPQELSRFMAMDSNNDGFLTAREAIIAENFPNETPAATSTTYATALPSPTPTSTSQSAGRDSEGNPNGGDSAEKASAPEARYVFNYLDKDRNGSLSSDEWGGSKKIREGFDKAGINLQLPTDLETFLKVYPPYRIVPQLRLPSN